MTVEEEIIHIIVEVLGLAPEHVDPSKSFVEDLNADSLDMTEIVMTIEERFGVEISQQQAELMRTAGDLIDFVRRTQDPSRILETEGPAKLHHQSPDGILEKK